MGFIQFLEQQLHTTPSLGAICLRLACAMVVGALIGIEREYTHRPAGLRTHILVTLGACVVSITGEMLFAHYSALGAAPDPARLSAQVITGVGFLGAGTIMKEGASVKGLTTAASVWAVACLGIASGFGYYALALFGMLFTLITLTFLETIQRKLIRNHSTEVLYVLETRDVFQALTLVNAAAQAQRAIISDMSCDRTEEGSRLRFRVLFLGRRHTIHHQTFFARVAEDPCVDALHSPAESGKPSSKMNA